VIVATHNDSAHLHNHFIICSVNFKTGYKWADNNDTRKYLQDLSDGLCKSHGLSVIENRSNFGIDQSTFHLATKGKSWKFKLSKILDEAVLQCKSKDDFIHFMFLYGYDLRYTNRHITFKYGGEKKSIRADTLAKSFGEKYTKNNLEKAMGYYQPPQNEVVSEPYKSKKSNYKGEIDLLELVKLKELDCFFYADKKQDTAIATVKKYNTEKLKSQVNILDEVSRILLKEKNANKRTYSQIKKTAEERGEKPQYRVVDENYFQKIKESGLQFAYFKKGEKYNIVFLKENEFEINAVLKSPKLESPKLEV
jgi:hypothetical protein